MEQSKLEARLFGGFQIRLDGKGISTLNQSRQQALLAYLMLHAGSPQARQQLAFNFWPDSSEERSYANLRHLLHHLRRDCPQLDLFLETTPSTLEWRHSPSFTLDVLEYEARVKRARTAASAEEKSELLIQAVTLYTGDLFPACYDDWIVPERQRLTQSYQQLLREVVDCLAAQDEYHAAIAYAVQLRNSDPLVEGAWRRLMQLYVAAGDRAAALRVYYECSALLYREMGVEPAPETRAAYEQIVSITSAPAKPAPPLEIANGAAEKLVGRQEEWSVLQSAWQRAKAGQPHLLMIRGEAGIGKTRLAEELLNWARQHDYPTIRTRAYAAEGQLAYAPVVSWLRADSYRDKVRALDGVWLVELARLLPELSKEHPALAQPAPMTDSWQRQRLFEALAHAALAAGTPLLVLIDDLQWADQETLEWLRFLLRFDASAALLVVGTARVEEVDASHPLSTLLIHLRNTLQVNEIELFGLDAKASAELVQQVANRPLDAEILAALHAYAEGVPLFLIEAVRAEAGKGGQEHWRWSTVRSAASTPTHAHLAIPPRVYAVLQARLAQLSPLARRLADFAAVIGRSFAFELLAQASDCGEEELIQGLDELWKRRILRERGRDYDMSHDRFRDVAYAEISPIQRRLLHRKVAQALEQLNGANLDNANLDGISAQLAWHYEHAAAPKRAIDFYLRAGMAAQRIYANNQARDLFGKGLTLLQELPAGADRDQRELSLQMAMAASLRTKNYLSPELNRVLNRALELSHGLDDIKLRMWPLWGLHIAQLIRGEIDHAHQIVRSLLAMAEEQQDPNFRIVSHSMAGAIDFNLCDYHSAQAHFSQALLLYCTEFHEDQVILTGFDHGIHARAWLGHNLWILGYGDDSLRQSHQAIELARELKHPFSQTLSMAYLAMLHYFRREISAVQEYAAAAMALAGRHEVGYYGAWAAILCAWAVAWQNPGKAEIATLQKALHDFRSPGSRLRWPFYLSLLAEIYGKAGQISLALATIDEAMAAVTTNGEYWWQAELQRMRGVFLAAQGADPEQIEAALQEALSLARRQQARVLELRAAMDLARLWQQTQRDQAYELLAPVYAQFTQGFDLLDLQEAKELLAGLA